MLEAPFARPPLSHGKSLPQNLRNLLATQILTGIFSSNADPRRRLERSVGQETRTDRVNRRNGRTRCPDAAQGKPVQIWAAFGAAILLLQLYVWTKWVTGPYFEQVYAGPTPLPMYMKIPLILNGVVLWTGLPFAIYYFFKLTSAKDEIKSPITWYAAALGMVVLGALLFMIARTGNDAATGVSDFELRFRNILDQILPVRPRTKEFMIGHPALIIGIGLLMVIQRDPSQLKRLGSWATLAIMVGAMGQTSIVNTMCHLHTPVILSIERIAEGIVIGSIIGLLIWMIVKPWIVRTPIHA